MSHLRRSVSATPLVLAIGCGAAMADARDGSAVARLGTGNDQITPIAAMRVDAAPPLMRTLDRVGWP